MAVRRHVLYSGNVQGVGFRWTVQQIASRYLVGGWVRNLPDGRVELVAEGERSEVGAVLKEIDARMTGFIREKQIQEEPPSGETDSFSVRY